MTAPLPTPVGARPAPAALLALGPYCLLLGIVLYVPFRLSAFAQQNDVFLANLLLGFAFFLVGSVTLLVASCQMAALKAWLTTLVSIAGAALPISGVATLLSANAYALLAPLLAAYAALLLALCTFVAARHATLATWSRALALAVAGAGLVTLYYALFGGRYHDAYGIATYLPRYLDGTTTGISLLLGIGVYLLGRVWTRRA